MSNNVIIGNRIILKRKLKKIEVSGRWIKKPVALWIHVELPVDHWWMTNGVTTLEDGRELTEIDFFNDDNDEYVGTISIPGSWVVYALVGKGYFEAVLVSDKFYDELISLLWGERNE